MQLKAASDAAAAAIFGPSTAGAASSTQPTTSVAAGTSGPSSIQEALAQQAKMLAAKAAGITTARPQLDPAIAEAIQRAKAAAALVARPPPTLGLFGSRPLVKSGSVGLAPPGAYPMRPGYIGKAMRPALALPAPGSPVTTQAVAPGVVPMQSSCGMTAGSTLVGCPMAAASSKSGSHATSIPQVSPMEASAAIGLAAAQLAGLVSQHMSGPAAFPAENCTVPVSNQEGESADDAGSKTFNMGGFATMKEVSPALASLMGGSLG